MSLTPRLLRFAVIEPCLNDMAKATGKAYLASPESVAMMLATAWVESGCGVYLAQQPNDGPAFGIWQIECGASKTAQDVLRRRVIPDQQLDELWQMWTGFAPFDLAILGDEKRLARLLMANHFACCMLARLRYLDYRPRMPSLRNPDPNPNDTDQDWWLNHAALNWANGYWRGGDREDGRQRFMDKLSRARDVLAEIENIRAGGNLDDRDA